VGGHAGVGRQPGIGHRCAPHGRDRQLARPQAKLGVRAVSVVGRPGADLDRRLVQRQDEQSGGGQFLAARLAGVVPLPGREVLGQAAESAQFLLRIGDRPRRAVDHGAAVVDRVLEHRTGQHEAVHHGDRDARDRLAVPFGQALAGHRAVQVQEVLVIAVAGRHHHRHAIREHPEVRDQARGEHGEQLVPVGPPLLTQSPVPGPFGGR
jgi:hypothetical protein